MTIANRPPSARRGARRRLSATLALLALPVAVGAHAQPVPQSPPPAAPPPAAPPPAAAPPVEVVSARVVSRAEAKLYRPARPGHADVVEVRPFLRQAGRAAWSQQGDWIAFDRADAEGRRDIYLVRPDGTGERCLTCDAFSLRGVSSLDPVWHPSGEWLVFRGQDLPRRMLPSPELLATPFGGVHSELWAIGRDGRDAWQLTRERQQGGALGGAAFSHEGGRLAWSARVSSEGPVGEWAVRVGEADWKRGIPRLRDVRTLEPRPRGLHLASSFTPDDRGLLLTVGGDHPADREVAVMDLESGALRPLSSSPGIAERLGVAVPRGGELVWVSDRGLEPARRLPYRGDLWIRSFVDGEPATAPRREERLTFFDDPGSDVGRDGETLIDDVAWSPAGDRLLVHVVHSDPSGEVEEALWLVVLAASYHR